MSNWAYSYGTGRLDSFHVRVFMLLWCRKMKGSLNRVTITSSRTMSQLFIIIKNVKWSRYRPGVALRVGRGIALLFHDRGTRRGEWSAARPGRNLPPGKTRYPLYRRLGGPQGRSGWVDNLVPTGIRSRTVQPVVSCYTDRATGPTTYNNGNNNHIN